LANLTHALYLLDRVLDDQASEAELLELAEMLRSDETGLIAAQMSAHLESKRGEGAFGERDWDAVATRILQADKMPAGDTPSVQPARIFYIGRRVAAAALLLLLAGATYFFLSRHSRLASAGIAAIEKGSTPDILPGGDKAILTLSNGKKIILDTAANGLIAQEGNSDIQKLAGGQLTYKDLSSKSFESLKSLSNTLSTPKGGQFQLGLPDGTRVWLNAASSVTYPTAFTGNERKVSITGEAYFEIARNASKPFIVAVNGKAEVLVLGTRFNINAYDDEAAVNTTLLEGSVRIMATGGGQKGIILKPGQQALMAQGGRISVVNHADIDQVMAWKNGLFNFNQADLQSVMRQLGRWYDVDIVYEREIPKIRFLGEMQRELDLSDVLDVLKRTDVHFRIEGRKIIVLP
jgi:transmembrane sensor